MTSLPSTAALSAASSLSDDEFSPLVKPVLPSTLEAAIVDNARNVRSLSYPTDPKTTPGRQRASSSSSSVPVTAIEKPTFINEEFDNDQSEAQCYNSDDDRHAHENTSRRENDRMAFLEIESGVNLSSSSSELPVKDLPLRQIIALCGYWASLSMLWLVILVIALPAQVINIVGEDSKGGALGVLIGVGAIPSTLGTPLFGALSDRCTLSLGRRRPFIIAGTLISIPLFFSVSYSATLPTLCLTYFFLQCSSNLCSGPFNGFVADVVPMHQRAFISGILGLSGALGNIVGVCIGFSYSSIGSVGVYAIMSIIFSISMITVCSQFPERPILASSLPAFQCFSYTKAFVEPFLDHDFRWVFLTRLLVQMGIYTVQENLQFYFGEAVTLPSGITPPTAVSIALLPLVITGAISSYVAGVLSDKYLNKRRKIIVYVSGGIMTAVCFFLIFFANFYVAICAAAIFGIGYGSFLSTDFAMILDCLPQASDAAKDMGLWHIAVVLPQALAAPISGVLLDEFQSIDREHGLNMNLGFVVIFSVSVVYFLLGCIFVRKIVKCK